MTPGNSPLPTLRVRCDDVRAGDVIARPGGAEHVVVRVEGPYEDGSLVVVYAAFEESNYENKARDKSGHNRKRRTVELSLFGRPPADPVTLARRDDQELLAEARRELADAERERRSHNILKISPTLSKYAEPVSP